MCVCVCVHANAVSAKGTVLSAHRKVNAHQLSVMKAAFDINCYLSNAKLMQVAQETGLGKEKIRTWFADRRSHIRNKRRDLDVLKSEYFCQNVYLSTQYSILLSAYLSFPVSLLGLLFCQPELFNCLPACLPTCIHVFIYIP